jgi:hypothetical protein
MSSSTPIVISNQSLVQMKQVDNSSLQGAYNFTDSQFESYICRQLSNQINPVDLSGNSTDYSYPNSVTIRDTSLNNAVIINNNDNVISSENFAMKINYVSQPVGTRDSYSYNIGDNIPTSVVLSDSTNSLYDSNLKIDVSLNEDTQYTTVVTDTNRWPTGNQWAVDYDRSQPYMNYFSCINSYSQDISGISPFYVQESSANIYALGNDPSGVNGFYTRKYFTRNTSGINDNIGTLVPQDICSNTLNLNYCGSYLQNSSTGTNSNPAPYLYDFSEFNSYKIVQDLPSVTNTILDFSNNVSATGSQLPIQFSGQDISAGSFNTTNIFNQSNLQFNNIGNGFQMSIIIGDVQDGGYTVDTNNAFTVDDSALTRDYTSPYLKIDVQGSTHTLNVNNGSVSATSNYSSGNDTHVEIGTEAETLSSQFNTDDGLINIYVKNVNNRVYYIDPSAGGGVNSIYDSSFGTPTSLTDGVLVAYTSADASNNGVSTYLNQNATLQTTEQVVFDVNVLAPSTSNSGSFPIGGRNLATNNSAVMTIAADSVLDPSNVSVQNFSLTSSIPVNSSSIYIVSVENLSVLTNENTQLVDASGSNVSGSLASVTMQNVDLSGINYEDYEVKLTPKTVTDISSALQLTNGWSVVTTDPAHPNMIGTPLKTSIIYDDYLFMTNGHNLDISMQYQFTVETPIVTSTQAIKHLVTFTFLDLSDNVSYRSTPTVAPILDDSEMTFTILSNPAPTVLAGCTNIGVSSLNGGNYNISNYTFSEYTQSKTYQVTFDSKFPFYTNLLFKTPVITETSVYYKIYDLSGNEQPSYLLKYFKCNDDNQLLSEVSVSLDQAYITNFLLTSSVCSIFKAELQGKPPGGSFGTIPDTPVVDLDPFFVLTSTISNIEYGIGSANISIRVNNNVYVDSTYYTIPLQNAPGTNLAFNAKKYVYSVNSPNNELDNFSLYADYFNNTNLTNNIPVRTVVSTSGSDLLLTIYDTNNVTVLATVTQPVNFINNYNIIVCLWPFIQVDTYYDGTYQDTIRTLAINNRLNVREGVYYDLNADPVTGAHEKFGLITDSFNLYHVNDISYVNPYSSRQVFTASNIASPLNCSVSQGSADYAKSVEFDILRGYTYVNSGQDVITLNRTGTTFTFVIDISGGGPNVNSTSAQQVFSDVYATQTLSLNAVVGQGPNTQTYDLGLNLDVQQSILADGDSTAYTVYAFVADFLSNIDSNPYNPGTIGILDSGFINDSQQQELFADSTNGVYIAGIKAACIKSYGKYILTVTRNVPDLHVYSLTTPNYVGDPRTQASGNWTTLGDVSYNDFLLVGYVASNLNVYRQNTQVVFYNNYTSYYVVAPPSINVYGYKSSLSISSVPLRSTSVLFCSFDVNTTANSYVITSNTTAVTSSITLSQPTAVCYASYLNTTQTQYPFQIEGNYISVSIYNGGVGNNNTATSPYNNDLNSSNFYETIISNGVYNDLTDLSSVNFSIVLDNSLNYQVNYNQFLPGVSPSHNATENIFFALGNAFTGLPPSNGEGFPSMYLRLKSSQGTRLSFYETNIIYNVSTTSYYLQIDKFNTDSTMNYNEILNGSIREVFFPVATHYTKMLLLASSLVDASGNLINQSDLIGDILESDLDALSWTQDNSFNLQYVGITFSALSPNGITALGDLLKYNSSSYLQSKALYVRRQDIIRVMNAIGNNVFRVTNSGNVQSNRVTTSAVSLYVPVNTTPSGTIGGSADVITLFAQETLITTDPL